MNEKKWIFLPEPELPLSKATILDMRGPEPPKYVERPHLTEQKKEEIRLKNEAAAKKPLIRLGKKGDDFYFLQERYTILERTDRYLFVEVRKMALNPDGSIPHLPDSRRELGKPFWDVRAVGIRREIELDGMDRDTGLRSEPREYINTSCDIELVKEDNKGYPTGELGYNADKDAVFQKFLEVTRLHSEKMVREDRAAKEAKENKKLGLIRSDQIGKAKKLRVQARDDIRTAIEKINIDSAMGSSEINEAVNRYVFFDTILKTL